MRRFSESRSTSYASLICRRLAGGETLFECGGQRESTPDRLLCQNPPRHHRLFDLPGATTPAEATSVRASVRHGASPTCQGQYTGCPSAYLLELLLIAALVGVVLQRRLAVRLQERQHMRSSLGKCALLGWPAHDAATRASDRVGTCARQPPASCAALQAPMCRRLTPMCTAAPF